MENDATIHGYRWSDGTVRHHPEPKIERGLVPIKGTETGRTPPKPPTAEQYAKAYAEWLREYNAWRADLEAWRAKHGTRS